jgi:acetate kinase
VHAAHPGVPEVACFDTAFHATMPPCATTVPLPADWRARWGLRRYGFHGLSHAYVSRRVVARMGAPAASRIVTCHLGAGASLAAVRDGRSVDTTMGFTPLEGLVMATRSGSLDPGLILWLERHAGASADELADTFEHGSGLLGLTGTTDMREIVTRAGADDANARLGLDVYLHHLRAGIAAMAAAMGGVDAIAFAGGVGEGSAAVRRGAAEGLGFLGVAIDAHANDGDGDEREITAAGAGVRAFVVPAREDLEMARQIRAVLAAA